MLGVYICCYIERRFFNSPPHLGPPHLLALFDKHGHEGPLDSPDLRRKAPHILVDFSTNIVWNRFFFYSRKPIFVDYQHFVCSLGCNFEENWFFALQCKTIHFFVIHSWGR